MGPTNCVLGRSQGQTNPFTMIRQRCGLLSKFSDHFLPFIVLYRPVQEFNVMGDKVSLLSFVFLICVPCVSLIDRGTDS